MTTAYYTHADCRLHEMGRGHPECPERLDAIADRMIASGLLDHLAQPEVPLASNDSLALAHSIEHVETVQALHERIEVASKSGQGRHAYIDPDTAMNPSSWNAVRRAAGAALAATDAVIDGQYNNAFCATRPPGHHATYSRAMGFCVFNNIAIAAKHALDQRGLARVAIVDFDVHHGNGTEDIFSDDPRCLMIGIFQHPFYPHSGVNPLAQNILNLPVPAYTKGNIIREMFSAELLPRLDAFAPEMIFISAGFDAHKEDDLGQLGMVEADYAWITEQLIQIANRHAQGRIVSCLEGGYNLSALGRSVEAHVRSLAGL